ncbi:MAG TPA: hypothetical protein VF235_00140 [Actinomycetota bacterium]
MTAPSPSPQHAQDPRQRRERAYRAGARMARERMSREAPLDARALEAVEAADIVVVSGTYDHVETVLDALDMPGTRIDPSQLAQVELRREQLLVINCPGQIGPVNLPRIRDFVQIGGSLFTTDWALRHVVEPAFPGTVAFNDRPTQDDVVPIEVLDHDNPFLAGVMDGSDDPQWWLEASSYPIRVLDRDRVQVLITSRRMERRYGEAPIAVLIPWGDGEVFHMVSHYYLQRTELRNARHRFGAASYFAEKGMDAPVDAEGLSLGDVESAQASARLLANVIARKKRKDGGAA